MDRGKRALTGIHFMLGNLAVAEGAPATGLEGWIRAEGYEQARAKNETLGGCSPGAGNISDRSYSIPQKRQVIFGSHHHLCWKPRADRRFELTMLLLRHRIKISKPK